jgi:hypothetical protein
MQKIEVEEKKESISSSTIERYVDCGEETNELQNGTWDLYVCIKNSC